mmetsp:Transcript_18469/g.51725  ORF Transcript_18469/g.51725 Transcript_18469/m.51725 type:complete len:115 (-) Transcript_18469:311-655(-)
MEDLSYMSIVWDTSGGSRTGSDNFGFSSDSDSSDEEGGDRVIVEGHRLWRHKADMKEKSGNKKRARMDMESRIAMLQEEGEGEFQATCKLSIAKLKQVAMELGDWLELQTLKAV